MQLNIDFAQQPTPDHLPDETQNQMLAHFDDVARANVDNTTANRLRRVDNNVDIFSHLERVQLLYPRGRPVQYSLINCVGHGVIDKLSQHQAIFALIKHLYRLATSAGAMDWRTWNVSIGNGKRSPMSASPASTALMCLVNSVRSSSLIVCCVDPVTPPILI